MKKKLFLGMALCLSFGFMFFSLENNNASVFKASLLEESPLLLEKEVASQKDWKNAFAENDEVFFSQHIPVSYATEFSHFLKESPLKMDIEVKQIENNKIFFSFFGAKEGSSKLNDGNYGYISEEFVLLSPKGTFSRDAFNTLLFTNTSGFPLFLDGEYLAISAEGDESMAELIALSEDEKNYILPGENFTVETETEEFSALESITYGFILSEQ